MSMYELYQLDWLIQHGYSLDDIIKIVNENNVRNVEDLQEVGIYGECFASFAEFCENEYKDTEYMNELASRI